MSGPLASWVGKHFRPTRKQGEKERPDPIAVAVVKEYALAADHWGQPTYVLTPEIIADRTGYAEAPVRKARKRALQSGGLTELEKGGGRGKASRFKVASFLCPADRDCPECRELARARRVDRPKGPVDTVTQEHSIGPDRPEDTVTQEHGFGERVTERHLKGDPGAHQTVNGSTPRSGSGVLPRGVDDRPAAGQPRGADRPGSGEDGNTEPEQRGGDPTRLREAIDQLRPPQPPPPTWEHPPGRDGDWLPAWAAEPPEEGRVEPAPDPLPAASTADRMLEMYVLGRPLTAEERATVTGLAEGATG